MKKYLTLLRGINVSGSKKVEMKKLKELYESLKLANVQTYIQTGNVIFDSSMNENELKKILEINIKKKFGFEVKVIIRTKAEYAKIIENNPFDNKERCYVIFLEGLPKSVPSKEIEQIKDKSEEFVILNKEIYLNLPNGYGRTKLSNNFFERKLGVSATTRNWKSAITLLSLMKNK